MPTNTNRHTFVAGFYIGGFNTPGSHSVYTGDSIGHMYDNIGPPPYLCFRCGQNQWVVGGPCPATTSHPPTPVLLDWATPTAGLPKHATNPGTRPPARAAERSPCCVGE